MTARSLAEAAADVLNGSRSGSPKASMPKLDDTGSKLYGVTDLGGASFEDPQGGDVGKKSAGMVSKASAPKGPESSGDGSKGKLADGPSGKGPSDVTLDASMKKTVKAKMTPVAGGGMAEEVDADESEEVIGEEETDEDTSEDEVEAVEEELTEEEIEAARVARWDDLKARMQSEPVKEDMDALFSGETLSEDFKTKATTIFEAAVLTRAVAVAESLEAEILAAAESAIEETRQELEEKVEGYLNFVVEQWIADNAVAIESGLKIESFDKFIAGMKQLFEENYVEVPEDKYDVLAAQEAQIEELTAKVNESINATVELTKKLNDSKKKEILNKVCEGLTATQAEKVKTLAEGVEFTTEGEYSKKMTVIRESYASGKVKDGSSVVALTEGAGPAEIEEEPARNPQMDVYMRAISATQK